VQPKACYIRPYHYGIADEEGDMGGACSTHGRGENCVKNFGLTPEGKRPLRRCSHRREFNITMDIKEIGWEGVDWMYVDQDREQLQALVNTVTNFWVL
jgi:hypothetical protein